MCLLVTSRHRDLVVYGSAAASRFAALLNTVGGFFAQLILKGRPYP